METFGFQWRQIAALLPGRSDSSIRNRYKRLESMRNRQKRLTTSSDVADEGQLDSHWHCESPDIVFDDQGQCPMNRGSIFLVVKAMTDTPDGAAHLPIVDSSATHAQRSPPAPPIAFPLRADADDDERRSSAGKRKHVISLGSLECAATQYAQVLDDQERGRCRRSHAPASAPPLSTSGGSQAAHCSPTAQELHSCSDSTDTPTRTPNISDTPTRTPSPGTAGHLSTNEMTSSAATLAHHLAPPLSPPLSPPALIPHRMCWHGRSSEDPELLKDGGEQPQVLIQASDDDWHRRSPAWYWHNLLPLLCYTCAFDVQDWASLNTRWTHRIPEAPFVAAMPIIYIWFGMIACNLVLLGPQTDKRQPLAIQLAGAALVCVHCLLAIRRFSSLVNLQ